MIEHKGNILSIDGSKVSFDYPIEKTLEIKNAVIVLLESPIGKVFNKNIFAINKSAKILWQVKEKDLYPGGLKDCPFVDIVINEEDQLVLFNWCSLAYIVNPETGEVLKEYETR